MAKKRLVVGNWKMYVESQKEAREFSRTLRKQVRNFAGVEVWLAPPSLLFSTVNDILESSPIKVGAQTISAHAEGAHTGDVSGKMLKEAGALFTLVGHSERRTHGDTNELVRGQLERAIESKLTAILCIGERERDKEGEHFEFLERQLHAALKHFPYSLSKLIVAYEPVWAIGKHAQDAMHPAELQEITIFIRKILSDILGRKAAERVPLLYGGSVEESNAHGLLTEGGVNGFLVGHASARIDSFVPLIQTCRK